MTLAAEQSPRLEAGPRRADRRVVAVAVAALAGGALLIAADAGWHYGRLYLLGLLLGVTLYHAAFGFSGAWRRLLTTGDGAALRAQLLMIAAASVVFLPALDQGELFGRTVVGAVAPPGVSVLVGAALFGLGMQLGGGCASGTLYTVGGGSPRMLATLAFFLVGSLLGAAHLPWWLSLPGPAAWSLLDALPLAGALAVQAGLLGTVALASLWWQRRRGRARSEAPGNDGPAGLARRLLQGPWPLVWGAVMLGLLNGATLYLSGAPWSVAFGYTLWAGKLAAAGGLDLSGWSFWQWPYPSRALAGSLAAETTSVMNLGIIVGAFLAAGLAGRFAPTWRVPGRALLAAALGGLLMGYAFGCNIGALFSGIASGSAHGWLWFAAALAGTWLGVRLRPWFGLSGS